MEQTSLLEEISAGAVLAGGANLMEGMVECAEEILGMPVRLGFPVGVKGLVQLVQGPQYATGVGLVRYGAQHLADAYARGDSSVVMSAQPLVEHSAQGAAKKSGFFEWFKAAF